MNTIPVTIAVKKEHSTLATEVRWCTDIGMYALDRNIENTCHHRTQFCEDNCYNNKLLNMYADAMNGKDARSEAAWQAGDVAGLAVKFGRSRKRQTQRARLMTRGEAFSTHADIARVVKLAAGTPSTVWWIPTRAWRDASLRAAIVDTFASVSNVVVLASMDPSNTRDEWQALHADGWATMYFGDDTLAETPDGQPLFKCPKTWGHVKGACGTCKNGCFKAHTKPDSAPVNVHLSAH